MDVERTKKEKEKERDEIIEDEDLNGKFIYQGFCDGYIVSKKKRLRRLSRPLLRRILKGGD